MEKTRYQQIISGEASPEGKEKGWANLEKRVSFDQMPEEKRREICRKGAEAVNKLHGKKKTAREALENILTLKITDEIADNADVDPAILERLKRDNPEATLYDLIQAVAVGRAVGGNMKAYELIRDTHGDKPETALKIDGAEIMTENDRAMIARIAERLEEPDISIVKDMTEEE